MENFDVKAMIDETERMIDGVKALVRASTKRRGPTVSRTAAANSAVEMLAIVVAPMSSKSREDFVNLIMKNLAKEIDKKVSMYLTSNVIRKAKKE